jgi:CO/xanthine dehydrogenase Mo-binding subunit
VTSFCIQIAQVGVDVETGQVLLSEVLNALDVAEILEPISHQNQIEGGMGIGYALGMQVELLRGGKMWAR